MCSHPGQSDNRAEGSPGQVDGKFSRIVNRVFVCYEPPGTRPWEVKLLAKELFLEFIPLVRLATLKFYLTPPLVTVDKSIK